MMASPFVILIAEDNPTDVLVMREALEETRHPMDLHAVDDGVAALAFLRRQGPYADAPEPHLVLLDLNMPRKNGHEVLAELKADSALRHIPVVVLTTSQSQDDVRRAYAAHANSYIRKPLDFERFTQVVQGLEHYWCTLVTLPHA